MWEYEFSDVSVIHYIRIQANTLYVFILNGQLCSYDFQTMFENKEISHKKVTLILLDKLLYIIRI